jgi:hypothetical protein
MGFKRHVVKRDYVSAMWCKQIGQALAKKFKVSVRKGKNWSADVDKGVLTYGPEIHLLTHHQALGILCHEISHLRNTKHPEKREIQTKYPELSHQAVNMLEDHRIEHIIGNEFQGAKESIAMMRTHMNAKCETDMRKHGAELKRCFEQTQDTCLDQRVKPFKDLSEYQKSLMTRDTSTMTEDEATRTQIARSNDSERVPIATQILLAASLMHHGKFADGFPDPEVNAKAREIADKMKSADIENMPSTQAIADFFESEVYPVMGDYFTVDEDRKAKRSKMQAGTEESEGKKAGYDAKSKSEEMRDRIEDLH